MGNRFTASRTVTCAVGTEACTTPRARPIMSSMLAGYLKKPVSVVTNDGRVIFGTLTGMDQHINIVLGGSKERVYGGDNGVEEVVLGHFIVRGDNIAMVG